MATSFTAHDALIKAFSGCRPKYSSGSMFKYALKPSERPFASAFLDSLEGMDEIAGQNGMIMAKVNALPLNECVAIHAMYRNKYVESRWCAAIISEQYEQVLVAMSVVVESLVPSITSNKLRDAIVARCLGIHQGTAIDIASRLGIHEDTFGINYRQVKAIIDGLKDRSMKLITQKLLDDDIVLSDDEDGCETATNIAYGIKAA